MRAWLAVAVLLCACGKPGASSGPDAGGSGGDGAASDGGAGWTKLISRSWTLEAGTEEYACTRIQVPTDMWISGFRALSPLGTHHEVLTIRPTLDGQTMGDYPCSSGELDPQLLYAAGLNTDDLVFPAGDAVHLAAGSYINLNLHLFDVSDNNESGESGVLVQTIDPSQVVHEIDAVFSGTFNIDVPNDGMPHTASGGCQAKTDYHVFALWPHMHQIGVHQRLTVTTSNVPTTLLDTDYSFSEQKNYPMQAVIPAASQILTTCTYVNNTGATITYGDSSTEEMCFTGIYKYPAGAMTASGIGSSDPAFSCTSN
jgi:Copper type II ascorbate-dependent monooxygenase, C-terminal domain